MAAEREENDTMTKHGIVRLRFAAGLALVVLLAVGCSSSNDVATSETTAASSTTTTTTPPKLTQPRQSCAVDTLAAASAASFEAPALVDLVCETNDATATLTNGPGGEYVVLFSLQNGVWVLVGSAPVADYASVAPADFSTTAVPSWQRLRDARLNRPAGGSPTAPKTDSPPSSLKLNPESGEMEVCVQLNSDFVRCTPPTTAPAPVDPEDPNAPAPTVTESMFCKYNYNDPRCVADPSFAP